MHVILTFFLILFFFPLNQTSANQSLEFIVENETFFKNLEHIEIDEFNDGRTFFGDILKTYFRYIPNIPLKRVTIETGALLDIPFGADNRVDRTEPIVSLHLDFKPGLRFTAGTLNRQHPLLDALFDDDLAYTDPIEQGIQLLGKTRHLKQDLWISWEVKETPTRREKFSVGNVTELYYRGLMVSGQLYWVHHGGQRNSGGGVDNNFSLAAGAGYSLYPKKWNKGFGFFEETGVKLYYLHNMDRPSGDDPDSDGTGIIGKVFIRLLGTEIYYQQWRSENNDFKPGKGDPLYMAKDYKELGVEKSFLIGDGIFLTAGFKGQRVKDKFVHIDFLSVSWRGAFSLFENYFKGISTVEVSPQH